MLNGAKTNIQVNEGTFEPIPTDKYTVQITDINLKIRFNPYKQAEVAGLNYEFTILDNKTMDVEGEGGKSEIESLRGRKLWRWMSQSLGTKSILGELVRAILGDLTLDEKKAFDPESIVDKQVDVMAKKQEPNKDGMVYTNIISFSKTIKELTAFDNDKSVKGEDKVSEPVIDKMEDEESDDFIKGLEKDKKKD